MVDDSEKPTDEPTKSASASLPTADQWKEAGATTLGLAQGTLVAFWARLKRTSNDKPVSSEAVPLVAENKEPTTPTDEPFPTVDQWAETGKTILDLTKRTADAFFNKPADNRNAKSDYSRQVVDAEEVKQAESEAQPSAFFAASQTSAINEQRRPASVVNWNKDELCVVNWSLSNEIRLPEAILTPGGSKVKCLNVTVNVFFRLSNGEPRVTRLTLGESNIAGLVIFTVAASRTGEGWTADASLRRYLERSILPTITEDDLKQDENLVRAMWGKYRSSLPDEQEATPWEAPTKKQLGFAKTLGIDVSSSMSKEDVGLAIENGINENPTLKKKLEEREEARRLELQRAEELQRIEDCGPELIAAEAQWEEFIDKTGFMLAVYQRGKNTIVDVLEVYEVFIDGKRKKKLKLGVASPSANKIKVPGILWDETHVLLLWDKEFVLALEKLLYYEPLRAKFDEADVWAYQRAVRRGLEIAKEREFKVSPT